MVAAHDCNAMVESSPVLEAMGGRRFWVRSGWTRLIWTMELFQYSGLCTEADGVVIVKIGIATTGGWVFNQVLTNHIDFLPSGSRWEFEPQSGVAPEIELTASVDTRRTVDVAGVGLDVQRIVLQRVPLQISVRGTGGELVCESTIHPEWPLAAVPASHAVRCRVPLVSLLWRRLPASFVSAMGSDVNPVVSFEPPVGRLAEIPEVRQGLELVDVTAT